MFPFSSASDKLKPRDAALAEAIGTTVADAIREVMGVPENPVRYPPSVIGLLERKRIAVGTAVPHPGSLREVQARRFDKWIVAECRVLGVPVPDGVYIPPEEHHHVDQTQRDGPA